MCTASLQTKHLSTCPSTCSSSSGSSAGAGPSVDSSRRQLANVLSKLARNITDTDTLLTLSSPLVSNCYTSKRSRPYWSSPPFFNFCDIWALWRSVQVSLCKNFSGKVCIAVNYVERYQLFGRG